MKALTLTQPWATLVAHGIKEIETRSWSTAYRGIFAVHAAKTWGEDGYSFAWELYERRILPVSPERLPRGAIVGTAEIIGMQRTELVLEKLASENELEFELGNYEHGRWAWILTGARRFEEPIPARGSLSLWNWDEVGLVVSRHMERYGDHDCRGGVEGDRYPF